MNEISCLLLMEFRLDRNNLESTKDVSKSNPLEVLTSIDDDVDLGTNGGISNSADKGTINVSSSNTPIGEKINKIERQICEGKLRFVDDDGNPFVPIVDSDSEVKVVFNETANLMISAGGKEGKDKGYGTTSLLEQWRDSYADNDNYDPCDDDMYENHDMSEHLQSICNDLDIMMEEVNSTGFKQLSWLGDQDRMTNTIVTPHMANLVNTTGKMFFYLTTLNLARFLKETAPRVEPPMEDHDCKELWESLERKYKTMDASTKKFVAEGMTLSETFQVAAIVEKLPPSWVEFKNYLKHKRKEMSVEDLVVRLRIKEDNKLAQKDPYIPDSTKVNMVKHA
ncbi:hypothetical protein Tco_0490986 [Tanacetum coccineum]